MKNKKIPISQIIRHIIQFAAFLIYPGLFISVFAALRAIVTALFGGTFTLASMGGDLLLLIAVFPITILWGRFFCGYLCSFGAIGDLIHAIADKLGIRQISFSPNMERKLKRIKYGILGLNIILIWILGMNIDAAFSPWAVFGLLTAGNFGNVISVGMLLLVLFLAGSALIERFFCRYLCPLGAIFSLVSARRLYRIKRNKTTCVNCALCTGKCSMGINVHQADRIRSGECIDCMKCTAVCPQASLYARPAPAVAGTAAALATFGLVSVGNVASASFFPNSNYIASASTASAKGGYQDGTYEGSGEGFRGMTQVEVTVENGNIAEINILSYEDDDQFFNKAKSSIIDSILTKQSVDVSTVSGATFSSRGIIEAVANALKVDSTTTQASGNNSTSDASSDNNSNSTSGATAAALDLTAVEDGTYTGTGTGLRGTTKVIVTVSDHKMTDITIDSYEDDPEFFERASAMIIDEILEKQSLDVSTVSGATFSSNSILEAVADSLGADFTNPNSSMDGGHFHHGQ